MSHYYDLGGTYRSLQSKETLAWLSPLLPKMGITRIANITGLDNIGIHVTTCIRPNAKHLSVSQGKGLSLELAEISAIMESIEGYHAENPPPIEWKGTFEENKYHYPLVNPNHCNRAFFSKFDLAHYPLDWTLAKNIVTGEKVYLPHILTCIDSTTTRPEYSLFSVSSNGLAAGNSLEEAICHALYEVIERDALARWQDLSQEQRDKTLLDEKTIQDKNKLLVETIKRAGLQIKIWEITSDILMPAFHCALFDDNLFRGLYLFTGTGAHLSREVALSRALTEAVQGRLTLITGNRDDVFPEYYWQMQKRKKVKTNVNDGKHSYRGCYETNFSFSFKSNIEQIISLLSRQGYDHIYRVTHTKADLKIPVVQVFIPGLRFRGARM